MAPSTRIALVSLYALENNGVRHIASTLREAGFTVTEIYFKDWVNNRFPWPTETEFQNLVALLERRNIDIVGISVRASAFHRIATTITRRVRSALQVPIIWGGMHPTFLPDRCIQVADMIALGEVDTAVVDFFKRWDAGESVDDSPGFWIRRGETVIKNDLAPLINNLETLPFRDYHTQLDKFHVEGNRIKQGDPFVDNPEFTLLASRGCPYWTCTFCSNTLTKPLYDGLGTNFRIRPVEDLIGETEYVMQHTKKLRVVRFDDEVFPMKRDWVEEFCEKWPKRVGIPFEVLVDPRGVKEDLLMKLNNAGMRAICMGIQANDRVNQELYHRNTTNEQIVRAQEIFARLGIQSSLQIIWDDPMSTEEDHDTLFRMLMELDRPFDLYLFGLTIYPHTHLARRLHREGRITEQHIEGEGSHAFEQFRVDLNYPRPASDKRWLALLVLLNKPFLPKSLIWKLYSIDRFKTDPAPLIQLASAMNLINMASVFVDLTRKGEMTPLLMKRWINPSSMITM